MELVKEKVSRKQLIEEKATELFRVKGYSASSMRDLASVVGIEPASIYSHVKSKEEILSKICFRLANQFMEALVGIEKLELTPEKKLKKLITSHIEVLTQDLSASIVFWNEWKHLTDPHLNDFRSMKSEYEKKFTVIVNEGIKCGYFISNDPKFITLTILSTLNGLSHWYRPASGMNPVEVGEKLADLLINGIIKRN